MSPDGFVDPEETRVYEEKLRAEIADIEDGLIDIDSFEPYQENVLSTSLSHQRYQDAQGRRLQMIEQLRSGASVSLACERLGISVRTYSSWRQRFREFAAKADEAKMLAQTNATIDWDGTPASFHAKFFGRKLTWFQLLAIDELENIPMGNILFVLWPPDHGKTSTFEDHASRKLALTPEWRCLVACESQDISKKILGAVMNRMDPMGPTPGYVEKFGPFMPQSGRGMQPWSETRFRVHKAKKMDQRDYSMTALGVTTRSLLSSRADQVHLDDIQSADTINKSDYIERRVRQDFFSRAGEHGRISLFGSRVDEDDVVGRFDEDEELDASVMKRIKLRAIITDHETGEVRALWPERYNLDQLDRMRRKNGQEAFDRNYLMQPGASAKGKRTFTKDSIDPCKNPDYSLLQRPGPGSILYATLDPSIGGKNCVMILEPTPDNRLIVRRIVERTDLYNNAQVIGSVKDAIEFCEANRAETTDLVIEEMAFQKGLMQDDNLKALRAAKRFQVHGHKTGLNKYDEDIGVPSMAESFNRGEIILPWAEDEYTRQVIGQLIEQLYKWKPYVKGNRLRQDMVMCLWFGWILWRQRWRKPPESRRTNNGFKTQGLPWAPTKSGILVPSR